MSTELTPIITQLKLDRERLRVLVNGDVNDTVQLEGRVEKSIRGMFDQAFNESAIDLQKAIDTSSEYATNAFKSSQAATEALTSINGVVEEINNVAKKVTDQLTQASKFKDDAESAAIAAKEYSGNADLAAQQASDFATQAQNTVDDLSLEFGDASVLKKPVILYPIDTMRSDTKRVSVSPVYEAYEDLLNDVSRKLNLYEVVQMDALDADGNATTIDDYELIKSYEFNSLNAIISDDLDAEKRYAVDAVDSADYLGVTYTSDPSDKVVFSIDDEKDYIEVPQIISGTDSLSPDFVFSEFKLGSGETGKHTTTEVIAIIDKKKIYRFDSILPVIKHKIPLGVLRPSNSYDVFVRYYDEDLGWSPYSAKFQITTEDPITMESFDTVEESIRNIETRVSTVEEDITELKATDFAQVKADKEAAEKARDESVEASNKAKISEDNAAASLVNAKTAADSAAESSQAASNSAVAASNSEEAAEDFVLKAEQILLEISQRSAGSFMVMGVWDASTGIYPTPESPSQPTLWIAGNAPASGTTIEGITYNNKDYLVYTPNEDGTSGKYAVVSNNDSVVSVNGQQGTVVISATDIGLGNVRNVESYSQVEADGRFDKIGAAQAVSDNMSDALTRHVSSKGNPHGTTPTDLNLGNVRNVASFSRDESDSKYAHKSGGANANFEAMPQVAGDAIIEIVRNANGAAIKYASGYMKCFFSETTLRTTSTTGASGGGLGGTMGFYVSPSVTLTFPVAFVGMRPVVAPSCATVGANPAESSSAPVWGFSRTPSLTTVNVGLMSYSNTAQGYVGYTAEGFWK